MVVLDNKILSISFLLVEININTENTMQWLFDMHPGFHHHYITLSPKDQHKGWVTIFLSHTALREISLFYEYGKEKEAIQFFHKFNPHLVYKMQACLKLNRYDECYFVLQVQDKAQLN